jgi:hypothetical protein
VRLPKRLLSESAHDEVGAERPRPIGGKVDDSLAPLEPHANFAVRVARFDVHDSRATANGAVFNVHLRFAAARIHVELLSLAAEWA